MGRRYVDLLRDGETIDEIYLVTDRQLRANRNGNFFLSMELRDRSGSISARFWNATDQLFRSFDSGDFLRCEGRTQLFQGSLQFIVDRFERVDAVKVDTGDFLPQTEHDIPKLMEKLRTYLLRLNSPFLRALGEAFMMDDAFVRGLCTAPAGVKLHHAYIGGLLEHTVTMMEIADRLAPFYPGVDRDLAIIGTFLHDLGKIRELTYLKAFGYCDEGQLIGHIQIGLEMLDKKIQDAVEMMAEDFPRELHVRLKHMIISHHGTLEFGSPKVPMTPEAMLLHQIDLLDTRMHMTLREIKDDRNSPSAWTPYNPTLGRRIYKGGPNGELFGSAGESYD